MKNTFALFSLMLLAVSLVAFDAGFSLGDILLASLLLIVAATDGNLSKIKELLYDGVDVNRENKEGMTALIWAKNLGHSEVAKV